MERQIAIDFFKSLGWNQYGAEVIVDTLIEDGMFEDISFDELKRISDDYADR